MNVMNSTVDTVVPNTNYIGLNRDCMFFVQE